MTRKSYRSELRAWRSRTVPGSMNIALKMAEARAKKKDLEFDISLSYLMGLYLEQKGKCALTGRQMVWERWEPNARDLMTIDRKDSSGGYTRDNVWLVCRCANLAKHELTAEEFHELCRDSLKEDVPQ